jgi:uncharacterized protein YegP (UPF0339 family)
MRTKIEIYTDDAGQWRWRKKAANFLIVGASSQGYVRQTSAVSNLQTEQGGTLYRDKVRDLDGVQPFTRGKRRIGVLHRSSGQHIVVLELEPKS